MSTVTKIEWLQFPGYVPATWNPVVGCSPCSPGCTHCYAARMATRFASEKAPTPYYRGLAAGGRWTGEVRTLPQRLAEPSHWRKPHAVFVCDMSDLWHERVPREFIGKVYDLAASLPQHRFFFLTKRADNLLRWSLNHLAHREPAPNIWFGVTACNEFEADRNILTLLRTPAAHRFVSLEPLLGPVDLDRLVWQSADGREGGCDSALSGKKFNPWMGEDMRYQKLDWVIMGGESGPRARPMHPDWARDVRDQCQLAGVPFFFKQWGEWVESDGSIDPSGGIRFIDDLWMRHVGKARAGHLLDGVEWRQFPEVR